MPTLTIEAAKAGLREADKEVAFWKSHRAEYLRKYPDQFVAVVNGEIVAASYDLQAIVEQLKKSRVNPREAWLQFFDTNPVAMVL